MNYCSPCRKLAWTVTGHNPLHQRLKRVCRASRIPGIGDGRCARGRDGHEPARPQPVDQPRARASDHARRRHLPPLGVLDPLRCHEGLDIVDFQQIDIRFLPVSRIGTDPLWGLLLLECDVLDQRYQLPLVRGRLTDLRDENRLQPSALRYLRMIWLSATFPRRCPPPMVVVCG